MDWVYETIKLIYSDLIDYRSELRTKKKLNKHGTYLGHFLCPFVLQYKWVMKMICPRCLNEDPQYFYQIQDRYYCRKCIHYGHQETFIQLTYPNQNVDYHLQYELTKRTKTHCFSNFKTVSKEKRYRC